MITKFLSSREKKTKMNHDVLTISYDYLANFKQLKRRKKLRYVNQRQTDEFLNSISVSILSFILNSFFFQKKNRKKMWKKRQHK